MQKLPLGKGSARLVSVKYPSAGGYTPGDTWDLYVGSDNRVEELLFRHGGAQKTTVPVTIVTWAGYKKAGSLLVSTDHRRDGGRQAGDHHLHKCGRETDGLRYLG